MVQLRRFDGGVEAHKEKEKGGDGADITTLYGCNTHLKHMQQQVKILPS